MADDRQRVLLAVLKARGPAHPADLAFHPAIRPRYAPFAVRFEIEADLEALLNAGKVRAYDETVNGRAVTVAYDAVDIDRVNCDDRYQRAVNVQWELDRRAARRKRKR